MVMAAVSWVPNMVHAPARAAISTAAITRSAIIAFLCLTEEDESASFDIQSSFSETIIFIYSFLAHRGAFIILVSAYIVSHCRVNENLFISFKCSPKTYYQSQNHDNKGNNKRNKCICSQ